MVQQTDKGKQSSNTELKPECNVKHQATQIYMQMKPLMTCYTRSPTS